MKISATVLRAFMSLFVLALLLAAPVQAAKQTIDDWTSVGEGIDYKEFLLPDPNHVYVARMDRSNNDAIIESSIGQGRLSGGGYETIMNQSARYDEAINYWNKSWGSRNKVVVAINGSYVDLNNKEIISDDVPDRGVVQSGWYAKRFTDNENGSGFAWQLDREAFIGECVYHIESKQLIDFTGPPTSTVKIEIDGINIPRGDNQLILYTSQYDSNTKTDNNGVEVLVEMTRPTLLLNKSNPAIGYIKGIYDNQGSTPIPFDHVVLSASGTARQNLISKLQEAGKKVGDPVYISQEITNCPSTTNKVDWTNTYASVGGGFYFLKNSEIQTFSDHGANDLAPRTAIAYNDEYIYYIVVDGRNPLRSIGMTMRDLGIFARDVLSATNGISEDGGGSSTMVINSKVVNDTFCNNGNCQHHVLLPMIQRSDGQPQTQSSPQPLPYSDTPRAYAPRLTLSAESGAHDFTNSFVPQARAVIDGMMMVNVEPISRSLTLSATEVVTTLAATDVRLGPGTNYAVLDSVPAGTQGIVLAHANGLNGVLAKGSFWWKVGFGSLEGWVPEEVLKIPGPQP